MSNIDVMIFDMDLSTPQKKLLNGESAVPTAPPPSPNSSSKRKIFGNISALPISRLIDCCEELVLKQNKSSLNPYRSNPLSMKRKTSDSDEFSSSAGTSPGGSSDCSCSFGKRSRSSFNLGSSSFQKHEFSMSELSAAISASENDGLSIMEP